MVEQNSIEEGPHRSKKGVTLLGRARVPGKRWPPHFVADYVYFLSQCDWRKASWGTRPLGKGSGERVGPQATCYESP